MTSIWKIRWLVFFLLFALPISFFPWAYLAFELPKFTLLFFTFVFTVYFLLVSGFKINHLTKSHYIYLAFLLWIVLTSILGLSFGQSFWGSYFRIQGLLSWVCYSLLFFVSATLFEDKHFRKYASLAILAGSVPAASLAIIQFITLWFFGNTSQLLYSNRVISTFGQPNFLGAYLVMSLPFAWFFLKQVIKSWKVLVGFLIIVVILGIFSTLSRSAYLGLTFLALLWGVYHYRLLLTGIIFSIVLFAILANLFPNLVYKEWYRFQVDTISKWTAENRLVIAQKSLQLISQRPILGYGIENFSLAFPRVVTPKDLGLKDLVVDSSHNLFLDLTVQTGLIGLGLFLAFLTFSIKSGLAQLKSAEGDKQGFIKASICVVVAFLIIHQFAPVSVGPMALLWLSVGILHRPALQLSTLHKLGRYLRGFIGIILISVTIFYIVQTFRAEYYFHQASAYEVSDIHKAIKLDNQAIELAPWVQFYQVRRNFLLKQLGINVAY